MIRLRKSRADKVKEALLSAASHADDALRDRRLHNDLRSAARHGDVAAARIRQDVGLSSLLTRLAEDKTLRKNVKALLEDLESAGERIRGKRSHRVRNVLLIASAGSTALAVPAGRRWVSTHLYRTDSATETLATAT